MMRARENAKKGYYHWRPTLLNYCSQQQIHVSWTPTLLVQNSSIEFNIQYSIHHDVCTSVRPPIRRRVRQSGNPEKNYKVSVEVSCN